MREKDTEHIDIGEEAIQLLLDKFRRQNILTDHFATDVQRITDCSAKRFENKGEEDKGEMIPVLCETLDAVLTTVERYLGACAELEEWFRDKMKALKELKDYMEGLE